MHRDTWDPADRCPATSGTRRLSTRSSLWWVFLRERGYIGRAVRPSKLERLECTGQCELQQVAGTHGRFWRLLRLAVQVTIHDYSFLFGPTLTYRTEHVAPFFHALFGGNHINASILGFPGSDTAFAMAFGGGLDLPVGEHFGVRLAQVDWLRTQHFSSRQNNIRFSTGIVFNF